MKITKKKGKLAKEKYIQIKEKCPINHQYKSLSLIYIGGVEVLNSLGPQATFLGSRLRLWGLLLFGISLKLGRICQQRNDMIITLKYSY